MKGFFRTSRKPSADELRARASRISRQGGTAQDVTALAEEATAAGVATAALGDAPEQSDEAAQGVRRPGRGSTKAKQMIVVRRDLKMRKGKIAAQAGHACVEATLLALAREGRLEQVRATEDYTRVYLDDRYMASTPLSDWFERGIAKVCVYVDSAEELLELARQGRERGYVVALIQDAGFTEFHGEATYTCLAFEPLAPEQIDPITGKLPLY